MKIIEEMSFKQWKKMIYVVLLFLIMISSSHRVDQKVMLLSEKKEQIKKLKAVYVQKGIELMHVKSKDYIKQKLKKRGVRQFNQRPIEIRIKNK